MTEHYRNVTIKIVHDGKLYHAHTWVDGRGLMIYGKTYGEAVELIQAAVDGVMDAPRTVWERLWQSVAHS